GRPQGVLMMERMMDRMAESLGLDPAEVRFRNLIPPEEFPYAVGMTFRDSAPLTYDSGNYPELLRRALKLADYEGARKEQAALRAAAQEALSPTPPPTVGGGAQQSDRLSPAPVVPEINSGGQ